MNIKPIRTRKDFKDALARLDRLIDARPGSAERDEFEVLSELVGAFEDRHYPVLPPDPIEAIKFRMDQRGLKQVDIARYLGGRSKASEVLSGRRALSLRMIRNLALNLNIPCETLLGIGGRGQGEASD